ncbi:putative hydroxyisocaproate dehydrogenase [Rhizopus microsporus ATCC 52813]|uniref:Putative hydroxyisocaproate dehydrogenase n=1 Tax=Rhizopus microsporus ATCC 52813 TaxID=1340429 RepID=A0A2G4SMW3_RHIZD|nr:putative hydroxyisocaproate dehydrogenase [Rhizopus microsporus ATCC 52813]PHZ10100.1 putative hydroxyisocaproate dehydrogenase [Rhizopus microsporus ATCC 52813]
MVQVLIVGCIEFATDIFEQLQKKYPIKYYTSRSRQEFIQDCADKYKDVSIIYRSPESMSVVGPFDADLVSQLPKGLKYIVYCGAGYDTIDVHACDQRQIRVSHTPMAVDDGTADIAVSLILACCRNLIAASDNLRAGRFRSGLLMGTDVQDKVLGIIGAGGIGRTLAKRMSGFDLKKIQYYNRHQLPKEEKYNLVYVDFETLLKTSDIISVNCPHTAETTHLLNYREFALMKRGVIIVNTARGKIINEAALVGALERGQVLSAGLDVFENEPVVHPGLLSHPRCVLLPHIGTYTNESQYKMEKLVLDNLVKAIEEDTLLTPVPEHKKYFGQ